MSKEKVEEKETFGEEEVVEAPKKPEANVKVIKPIEKVKIIIDESDDENSSTDVVIGVQGYMYQIRRGVPVEVPVSVVEVLNHCITTKMIQNMETFEMTYKNVPRYSYRILNQ